VSATTERRRSKPQRVGSLLDGLFERIGIRERVERAKTASRWSEIVGPHIAKVTRVGGVRGGTLFVEVDGAAWMTELDMMRRKMLSRLNEDRERGRIDRIVFVQAENAGADRPRGRGRHATGRG
jgi:predicted nucleic acid-binding Zn ribbon protein